MLDATTFPATIQPHPLTAGRTMVEAFAGQSIADILRQAGPDPRLGLPRAFLIRNGRATEVPMRLWTGCRPKAGTRVDIRFDPPEGPAVGAVLTAVLSAGAGSVSAFVFPGLAAGGLGSALATTAITVLGSLAISALIPPPAQPKAQNLAENYVITGAANTANPYGTFPKVLGRRRVFPPKSAGGYSEQIGKTAYWRGRFCFGWGPLFLEDIRIGNTPITDFDDVSIEFLNVDKARTLAAHDGLENMVFDGLSETHKPSTPLKNVGDNFVFSPRGVVDHGHIKFTTALFGLDQGMTVEGQSRIAGDTAWDVEAVFSDLGGGEYTYNLPSYPDSERREYRLIVTGIDADPNPTDNPHLGFIIEGVKLVSSNTITEAFCEYKQGYAEPGWRSGTERMQLYQDDVFEEGFDVLLVDGEEITRVSQKNTDEIGVDLTFKYGCYNGSSKSATLRTHSATVQFEYRRYGDSDWIEAGTATKFTAKSKTAYRVTKNIVMPSSGEWEVRCTRVGGSDSDSEDENRIWLTGLRSFQTRDLPSFDGVAEIAVRFKATDQLNGQIENLNAIVNQLAPVWDGAAWGDPEPNRHPAWALADWLRGPHSRRPVADSKIDLAAFKAWADDEPHWTCDYVFDTETRMVEGAALIASTGRATMHLADMRYSVIRDGGAGPIRQVFTPRNSWGFASSVNYRREIHGLRVLFNSERKQWQQEEITVYMDGFDADTATEFETLELEGVVLDDGETDLGNIYRLARYHLAQAVLRPETFEWQADFENLRVTRGDKVRLVNDVVKLGHGQGRIAAIGQSNGDLTSVTLDERFPLEVSAPYRLTIRLSDGDLLSFTAELFETMGHVWTVTDAGVGIGAAAIGDLVIVEEMTVESYDLLVTSIRPSDDLTATITATNAAPEVLDADSGDIPAFDPAITEPVDLFGPPPPMPTLIYSGEPASLENPGGGVTARIGVDYGGVSTSQPYLVRLRWSVDGGESWTEGEALDPSSTALTAGIPDGENVIVQIRTESLTGVTRGWVDAGTVEAASAAPAYPEVAGFVATAIDVTEGAETRPAIDLAWDTDNAGPFLMTWEIRIKNGVTIDAGRTVQADVGRVLTTENILPRIDHECRVALTDIDSAEPVWTDWQEVTVGSVSLSELDLSADLSGKIDEAYDRHDDALDEATGTIAELRAAVETSLGPLDRETPITAELPRIGNLEQGLEEAYQRLMDLQWQQHSTTNTLVGAGFIVDEETGAVRITGFEYQEKRITNVEINLDAVEGELSLKASMTEVNQAISDALLDPSQIPLLDDMQAQISSIEITLDSHDAEIALLSDTLTVEGELVTMTTVTQSLDSINGVLSQKVSQTEMDAVEQRVTTAEQELEAFGDSASIRQTVAAARSLQEDQSGIVLRNIADLWDRWAGDETAREASASGRREIKAEIAENEAASASERLTLQADLADTRAVVDENKQAQVDADSALAADISSLTVDVAGVSADVSQTQAAVVSLEGQAAASASDRLELRADIDQADAALVAEAYTRATEDAALAADISSLTVDLGDTNATVAENATASATADAALAADITTLTADLGDTNATVTANATASANEDAALAQSITGLTADLGATNATVGTNYTTLATADAALAEDITTLTADLGDTNASLSQAQSAIVTLEGDVAAGASDRQTLQANIDGVSVEVEANALASATADAALASDITDLTADLGETNATITQNAEAMAAADAALASDISELSADLNETNATVTEQAAAIVSLEGGATAAASDRLALHADIGQAQADLTDTQADIESNRLAQVSGDAALASDISTLTADLGATNATVTQNAETSATADSALAADIAAITADLGDASAAITQNATTSATADAALAADISTLAVDLGETNATVTANATAMANADSALATDISALEVSLGETNASVTASQTAITTLEGHAEATFTLRLGAGGAAAGLELVAADNPVEGDTSTLRASASSIILDGSVLAKHLSADSLSVAGLAIFGGTLKSTNYVEGESGWIITQDGDAQFNDLIVTGEMIAVGAITAGSDILAPAAVGTLEIEDRAVTIMEKVSAPTVRTLASVGTFVDIAHIIIDRDAGFTTDFDITGQIHGVAPTVAYGEGAVAQLQLWRDSTLVFQGSIATGYRGARNSFILTPVDHDMTGSGPTLYTLKAARRNESRNDKTPEIFNILLKAQQRKR